jgi:hypothetical protein
MLIVLHDPMLRRVDLSGAPGMPRVNTIGASLARYLEKAQTARTSSKLVQHRQYRVGHVRQWIRHASPDAIQQQDGPGVD